MIYLIILPITNFLIDLILVILNLKHQNNKNRVNTIFNDSEYGIFLNYSKEKQTNKIKSLFVKLVFIISLIVFLFDFVIYISSSLISNEIIQSLFTVLVLYTIYQTIDSLTEMYDTFTTESKYGFNKTTVKMFIKDQIIDYIASVIILLVTFFLMVLLYNNYQDYFLLGGFVLVIILLFLYHTLFVILFMPMLFKFEPIQDNKLYDMLTSICKKENFNLDAVLIAKASEKTTKLNAMFSGFGKSKKVMLFDTLLDKFSHEQIISIVLHEIGHSKNKDMFRDMLIDLFKASIYFVSFYIILTSSIENGIIPNLIYIIATYPLLSKLLKILSNTISRYEEKQADLFVKEKGYGNELVESLKSAAKGNLSNLTPHPLFTFFKANHPPLLKRIDYLSTRE